MKKIFMIIPAAVLLTFCKSSQSLHNSASSGPTVASSTQIRVANSTDDNTNSSDTVIITGTQYVPIEGRSETGTRADLEGAWSLDSLNGALVPGKSNINVDVTTEKLPEGGELRHDSTTRTETVDGVTHTTTTVLIDKMGTQGNKITPPQGANYHIPAKPSINFYGSNETFSGFTGCNRFSGRYALSGTNTINLQSAAASTKMVCIGDYDEVGFLNTLRRVNTFRAAHGQLELLEGNNVLLVFSKNR